MLLTFVSGCELPFGLGFGLPVGLGWDLRFTLGSDWGLGLFRRLGFGFAFDFSWVRFGLPGRSHYTKMRHVGFLVVGYSVYWGELFCEISWNSSEEMIPKKPVPNKKFHAT